MLLKIIVPPPPTDFVVVVACHQSSQMSIMWADATQPHDVNVPKKIGGRKKM